MKTLLLPSMVLLAAFSAHCPAQQAARAAGRAVGEFGAGVGEVVGESMARSISSLQPEWVTVPPRPKEECITESKGVLDATYMRCRSGRQEYVQFDAQGRKRVLGERPIPTK